MIQLSRQAVTEIKSGKLPVLDATGTVVGFAFTDREAAHLLHDTYTTRQLDKLDMKIVSMSRVPIQSSAGTIEAIWPVAAPVLAQV